MYVTQLLNVLKYDHLSICGYFSIVISMFVATKILPQWCTSMTDMVEVTFTSIWMLPQMYTCCNIMCLYFWVESSHSA